MKIEEDIEAERETEGGNKFLKYAESYKTKIPEMQLRDFLLAIYPNTFNSFLTSHQFHILYRASVGMLYLFLLMGYLQNDCSLSIFE